MHRITEKILHRCYTNASLSLAREREREGKRGTIHRVKLGWPHFHFTVFHCLISDFDVSRGGSVYFPGIHCLRSEAVRVEFLSNSLRISFKSLPIFHFRVSLGFHLTLVFLPGRSLFTLPPRNSITGWIIFTLPSPFRLPACQHFRSPAGNQEILCRSYIVGCIANRITSNHDDSCLTCYPITQARLHACVAPTDNTETEMQYLLSSGVSCRPRTRQRLKSSTGRRCSWKRASIILAATDRPRDDALIELRDKSWLSFTVSSESASTFLVYVRLILLFAWSIVDWKLKRRLI